MKKLLSLFMAMLACSVIAQSQVSGNLNTSINFNLISTNAIGTANFPLSLPAFIQGALSYGTAGTGIGHANQLYAAQLSVTNGALVGTNWLNFNSFGGGNDFVGNAFAQTQVKMLVIQNLGVAGSPAESSMLQITGTSDGNTWTNILGATNTTGGVTSSGVSCPGPSGTPSSANTPTLLFWAPGDKGWSVASSGNTKLCFTNPVSGGNPILVNVYVVGSTGL